MRGVRRPFWRTRSKSSQHRSSGMSSRLGGRGDNGEGEGGGGWEGEEEGAGKRGE